MKSIIAFDHALTAKIRAWGQPGYVFWKFVAGQSIGFFALAALAFAYVGQLNFWHFLIVFTFAYLIANLFQHLIKRNRPDFERLTGYKMWIHTYSYPSAHATMSAAAATAICLLPAFSTDTVAVVTIASAVVLAFLIGLSRIVVGVHYLADVAFGWLLGFVIALAYVLVISA
ncbi:MAG: acidPPc protein [Patescibacteria group bacterium]|jgi:membrane-associated phospholipid phosphatase|nr:acidPPc protein [Patescibacteria group bacterium]